ncbi:MAG TPA: hypothetical protein VJ327_08365 [Patescibacteria group bacterium]|nr:hypothetical protein [Patescibacteria group bacterium]
MSIGANFDLFSGSDLHTKIREGVRARIRLGREAVEDAAASFEDSENRFLAYMPTSEVDAIRKAKRSAGSPQYTTIQIPYSYAVLLSAHTYWTSVFLGRNPVLQFAARHGEPEARVQAVDALIDYQMNVGRMIVPLYIWMHDAPKYSYGVLWNYWEEELINVAEIIEEPAVFMGMPLLGKKAKKIKRTKTIPGYVGNKIFNVRPQDCLLDPRVPLIQLQSGEFVGRYVDVSWNTIINGADSKKYIAENVIELQKRLKARHSQQNQRIHGSSQVQLPGDLVGEGISLTTPDIADIGFVSLVEIYIRLIPKNWHLGKGASPEIWIFTLADDEILLEARPHGALHGKFPVFILPYEIDGYAQRTRSMLEILKPLEDTMTWLVNTHFYNVRSALNNQFVYDPSRIVTKDLTSGSAERLIRLKEAAWGTDVRASIMQLPVVDVTQGHIRDMQLLADMIQRVSGVTDNIMGMVNAGGRKTATEVRTSSSFGINRLKTTAEYWSAGDYSLMAQIMLQNTQQYYELERQFKIAGDLLDPQQAPFRAVSPEDIQGFFDFVPVDGTMPIDRFAQANLWRELLAGMRNIPELQGQYKIGGIFEWMAQLAGMRNIKQFRVQVVPDAQAAAAMQAGNTVPIGGANGNRNAGAGGGGAERDYSRIPEPGQVSGMGTTG